MKMTYALAALFLCATGCVAADESDEAGIDTDAATSDDPRSRDDIDDYVRGLGTLVAPEPETIEGEPSVPEPSGHFVCSTKAVEQTRRYDEIIAFATNSNSLFPGAIVSGDAAQTGLFAPKVLPRAPLRISASLEGVIDGDVAVTMENPSLSEFRESMQSILDARVVGQTPAQVHAEIEQIHSEQQLGLALGAKADFALAKVAGSLRFNEENTRSRYVVRFTQTYYTVDVDSPGSPASFFADDVTVDDVETVIGDVPPAYVTSVTYGRTVLFAVTSELSSQELQSALEFAYRGTQSIDANVSLNHKEVLTRSQITAFILGGSGDEAVKAIYGFEELRDFIEAGGSWTRESPGAPIAYKLAWLANHSPARYSLTSDYDELQCSRVTQNVRIALQSLTVESAGGDPGDDLEIYGRIHVVDEHGDEHDLWDIPSSNYVRINEGETWPSSGDDISSLIIPVTAEAGSSFDIVLELYESDAWGNDKFPEQVLSRPFELGWRDDFAVPLAVKDQQILVSLSLRPVE